MAEIIKMPRLSDTMEEGVIVSWLKKVGDKVSSGDTLAEVETDKATMELDSFTDGVLLHIAVEKGAVPVNSVIAVIGAAGEDFQAALAAASNTATSPKTEVAKPEITSAPAAAPVATQEADRLKASPLAKSIAKESGIDLQKLQGTGDSGRIVKRDVEAFLENKTPHAVANTSPANSFSFAPAGNLDEDLPLSQMRKTIARRLSESMFSAPHFYLTMEANMDKSIETRERINETAPTKISFNDLVVKAVAASLRQHPAINSSWLGDKIRKNGNINIGVAVAVEDGLLVPVIRNADIKTLSQINAEVKALAEKAKQKKLAPEEMQGNTFTISNLGMFGIEEFTAIINPPDACILAVGGIIQKPIVKNGELAIGNLMRLTLSCDHRVIDGATGARFLQTLKGILEDPLRLLY